MLRGKVRLDAGTSTNPVAVGDRVVCECPDNPDEQTPAVITEILDRRNCLRRKSTNLSRQSHVIAANLDSALIVVSLHFPEVKLPFLDRELVCCGMYGIPATIVLNKTDLYGKEVPEQIDNFKDIYAKAGYGVLTTSTKTGEGMDGLRELCRGKLCLLSGESGVGKSSIVKALDPALDPKIGNISSAHLQGRHTTSLYEMYPLSGGGFVIDTPGLRGFGLVGVEREEIYTCFPEMLKASENCRFTPCSHRSSIQSAIDVPHL